MDSLDNPELFQTSMVVQKSSKSGIFSNKRLLVIKNGFLYYFSDVPKNYKTHVPNILSTFKDLPKSSIQIRNIQDIRLQSAKSSSLVIKFYEKDMIDKQDLRKSISNKSYSAPQKKNTKDTDEWIFTFPTVLLCRMWFNALMRLKQYFKKQEDHFQSFINNFNSNQKGKGTDEKQRTISQIKPLANSVINTNTNTNTTSNINNTQRKTQPTLLQSMQIQLNSKPIEVKTQLVQNQYQVQNIRKEEGKKQQTKEEGKKQQTNQKQVNEIKKQLTEVKSTQKLIKSSSQQTFKAILLPSGSSQKINVKQSTPTQVKKQATQVKKQVEVIVKRQQILAVKPPQIVVPVTKKQQVVQIAIAAKQKRQNQISVPRKEQLGIISEQDQLRIKNIQQQIRNQIEDQIRFQQKHKKQKQIAQFQRKLQEKQRKIQNLQTEIRLSKVMVEQRHRQLQDEKATLIKKNKLQLENSVKQHKQISIFQQSQRKFIEQHNFTLSDDESQQQSVSKNKIRSNVSKLQPQITKCEVNQFSVQTDQEDFYTQNQESSRINNAAILQKARNSFFSDFNLSYRQTLNLLRTSQNFSPQKFENYDYFKAQSVLFLKDTTSQQRMRKQVQFLSFVKYTRQKAQKVIKQYIEDKLPTQSKIFQKEEFLIEIVCSPGKIVNIQGQDKLVYSNKSHQSLKRQFKIYQKLQRQILKCIKKKDNFPLRVPLCILVQYRGYSAIAKILPSSINSSQVKEVYTLSQIKNIGKKYMKQIVESHFVNCFDFVEAQCISSLKKGSFVILVKLSTVFKITDVQKDSQLFSLNQNNSISISSIHNVKNEIEQCRQKSISICRQKLSEDLKISVNTGDKQNQKKGNSELLYKKLNYIKVCRQLKKILKSTQPFCGDCKQHSFFRAFLQNPQQISKLIPSNIDESLITIMNGQLFYYLQMMLGLKLNMKYCWQTVQNINQIQLEYVPLTRSFQLTNLISYQHAHRFNKYNEQQKIQSLQSSYKIISQIQSDQILKNIAQSKLLLKVSMVQTAVQRLFQAKTKISFHDKRKIQIHLLLISAYITLGKQTEVLKELREMLQFIEYMYGADSHLKLDVYLLMTEALVRMGNLAQAIKIYHLIFQNAQANKSTKFQDKSLLYLSFSKILHHNYNADPYQLISFISQFVDKLNSKDINIKIQTSMHLGQLNESIGKLDKAKKHYEQCLVKVLKSKNIDKRFKIAYSALLNLMQNYKMKENMLNQIIMIWNQHNGLNNSHQSSKQKLYEILNTLNILNVIQNLEQRSKQLLDHMLLTSANQYKNHFQSIFIDKGPNKTDILSFEQIRRNVQVLVEFGHKQQSLQGKHKQNLVYKQFQQIKSKLTLLNVSMIAHEYLKIEKAKEESK